MNDILIYGANGYTALLILDLLAGSAVRPILAGRSAPAIEALAKRHGLPWRYELVTTWAKERRPAQR